MHETIVERYLNLGLRARPARRRARRLVRRARQRSPPPSTPSRCAEPGDARLGRAAAPRRARRRLAPRPAARASAPVRRSWPARPARTPTRSRAATACGRSHTDEAVFAAAHRGARAAPARRRAPRRALRDAGVELHRPVPSRPDRGTSCRGADRGGARVDPTASPRCRTARRVGLEIVRDRAWPGLLRVPVAGCAAASPSTRTSPSRRYELLHLTCSRDVPRPPRRARVQGPPARARAAARVEETLVLVPAPQSLVSEGIAELAPELLLAWRRSRAADGGAAPERHRARPRGGARGLACDRAVRMGAGERRADAARARRERGRCPGLSRALGTHDAATRRARDPLHDRAPSRTYAINYSAGRDLCRSYVDGDPAQFRRLLTEQVRVSDLR